MIPVPFRFRTIIPVLTLLLVGSALVPLAANTRFGFGTIVKVDPTGEDSRKGQPSFTVRFAFRNLNWSSVGRTMTFRMEERTRHGWRVYLLDGEPSTAEEALAVGRAICVADNDMVCRVSTAPGPFPLGEASEAGNAVYRFRCGGAFRATLAKQGKRGVGDYEAEKFEVEVILDVRDGAVAAATAVVVRLRGDTDHRLDPAAFAYADGAITGEFTFDVAWREGHGYRTEDGEPVTVSCAVEVAENADGELSGSFTGSSGGIETGGDLKGRRGPAVAAPPAGRIWLQFDELRRSKCTYAVVPFADDAVGIDGELIYFKGYRIGPFDGASLRFVDGRLRGTARCVDEKSGGKAYELEIDAHLYGGRMLLGTYTIVGEDGEGATRGLRGGTVHPEGPVLRGTEGEERERIRALQAELHPEESKK